MAAQPDPALISATLSHAALCLACIAKTTSIPKVRAAAVLADYSQSVKIAVGAGVCAACLRTKPVFRLH